jgi:hypothetical protein
MPFASLTTPASGNILDARFFFLSRDVQPSTRIAMVSELSIFAPLRQALLCCFQFYR